MKIRLALLTLALCLAVSFSELTLRFVLQAWPFETELFVPVFLTKQDAPLRWRFSQGSGRNSLGLRNREVAPKERGAYRILFLGDSLVWTSETSSKELYTQVIERRLNERRPVDRDGLPAFEVINAGVPGYTTYQELEFLKIYGLAMEPDLVVLGYVFNDLHYKYLHKPTNRGLLDREPSSHLRRFDPRTVTGTLFSKSFLANEALAAGEIVWSAMRRHPDFPFERRTDFFLAWKDYAWVQAEKLIDEMNSLLTSRQVSLRVLVFPVSDQVDDRYRQLDQRYVLYPQGRIREMCRTRHIGCLDLTAPIHERGGLDLFQDYLHLNAKGNDVVADEVLKYLINELNL